MDKRTKKDLSYLTLCILLVLSILFLLDIVCMDKVIKKYNTKNLSFKEKFNLYKDIGYCAEDSYCKAGLIIDYKDGKPIKVDKNICLKRKGKWYDDRQACQFGEYE